MSIITPMVRPMVRPMVTAMGKGGQRTPAQIIQGLFAAGQQGFWLPFTDFASLSQDSAGTLPYTALEQPVGRVLDRSGRGNNASQVTSSARGKVSAAVVSPPTRPYYLQLDGVDDFYTCGGGGSTTGFFYSDVVRINSSSTQTLINNGAGGKGYLGLIVGGTNKARFYAGNGTFFTQFDSIDALVIGVPACVQMWDDGVNLNIQINNGAIASVPRPVVLAGTSTMTLCFGGGGGYFNGQITEPIFRVGPPPNAYERGVIREYQKKKAGMV